MKKTCFKCGEEKPLDDFYIHSRMLDGHLNKCKECTKRDVRLHRRTNGERAREYDRKRNKIRAKTKAKREYQSAYGRANRIKRRAQGRVRRAIADGRIARQPCEVCGNTNSEAHHDDYSRPLDVRWLCRAHHAELHMVLDSCAEGYDIHNELHTKQDKEGHDG